MSEPTWELLGGGGVVGGPIDYVGDWAAGTLYQPGQVVRYQGTDYLAVNPSTGVTPPPPFFPGNVPVVTTLPALPFDGQEVILVDSFTVPTYSWRFKYVASITGANKWIFIGGSSWSAYGSGNAGAGAVYTDWSSANPTFIIPRTGTYLIRHGAGFYGVSNGSFFLSVKLGAAATSDAHACRYENAPQTVPISLMRSITVPLVAADIVKLQGKASVGNLAAYYNFMEITPVIVA